MLPNRLFRLSRNFSSRKTFSFSAKLNIAWFFTVFGSFIGYYLYTKFKPSPKLEKSFIKSLEELSQPAPSYEGVSLPNEAEKILKESQKQFVVLFSSKNTGKTYFMKYLREIYKPSLLIELKPDIIETMNSLVQSKEFSNSNFNEFFGLIEGFISENPKTLLLIDGLEKINENYRKRLLQILETWIVQRKIRLIISTNERVCLSHCRSCSHLYAHSLKIFTHDEYHSVLSLLEGYNKWEVEKLWKICGSDLDYGLEMIEKKLKCDEFLEIKKEFILNELKKFIDSDFSKKSIRAALNNVNDQRPLGDVFAGTKLARVFCEVGIMQEYPDDNAKFRNQFVIRVIRTGLDKDL